jgi:S-DNA-T family DNA segregation ATPase FtsK/SpoIIIE
MFESRDLKQDLFALALAAVVVFLALALGTYDSADPLGEMLYPISEVFEPNQHVYPLGDHVTNVCGRLGAVTADIGYLALGAGAWYLTISLGIVATLMLLRRPISSPGVRLVGWLVSLVGITSLMAIALPGILPSHAIGPGGYLGALASGLLLSHFATAGAVILSVTMLVGGLLLCTDYVLLQLAAAVGLPVARRVACKVQQQLERRRQMKHKLTAAVAGVVVKGGKRTDVDAGVPVVEAPKTQVGQAVELQGDADGDGEDDADGPRIKFMRREAEEIAPPTVEVESDDEAEDADDEVADDVDEEADEEAAEVETPAPATAASVPAPKFLMRQRGKKDNGSRDEIMNTLDAAAAEMAEVAEYELPPIDLLLQGEDVVYDEQEKEVRYKAKVLEQTFQNFGYNVRVVEIETGPVIAQYEIELEAGLRLAKITNLADDLAIALRVPSVRIVAPIPGKNTVGIEVPNTNRQMVRLRDVMEEANGRAKKMAIPIYLGKDVSGHPMVEDLARMPHLLIAGRTGTGKSVCLNAIISSVLMTKRPDEVRMLMIDPKMVELSGYGRLPHLMHPVVTDMRKAEAILAWAVEKMEERYALLAQVGVRQISSYNQLSEEELYERVGIETDEEKSTVPLQLPYIVIIADEIADLMMVCGKEVEQHIIRLAQKSRAVGIHLILATQKPTVDVITGLIKSNLPARISFQVASRTDSRVVLDEMGADKLLGDGDMLFLKPGTSQLLRGQGTYLSDDEINAIVARVSTGEQNFVQELVALKPKVAEGEGGASALKNRDELYEAAIDIVIRERRGSVSLLQRNLGIGYGRAARLIDFMAEDGIVGQYAGSQAREVLLTLEDWEAMQAGGAAAPSVAQTAAQEVLAEAAAPKADAKLLAKREPSAAKLKPANAAPEELSAASVTRIRRSNKIIPVPDWDDDEEVDEADEQDAVERNEADYDEEHETECDESEADLDEESDVDDEAEDAFAEEDDSAPWDEAEENDEVDDEEESEDPRPRQQRA